MIYLFFFFSFFFVFTFLGYPLIIFALANLFPLSVRRDGEPCSLSVIVCARDEGERIGARIENLLAQDYPHALMEILIVSDGSTDMTDAVVRSYAGRGVKLVRLNVPKGKAAALNAGVGASSGKILLMSDARQRFEPDVARRLVSFFADESVGAVSGRLSIQPDSKTAAASGVGSYWNYEVRLRANEAASGSVIGVTGAIYALRRVLFEPLPEGAVLDDVLVPMRIALAGKRILYDEGSVAVDAKAVHDKGELARKVRTLYGNLQLYKLAPELFLPTSNPLWFRFVSHKILRLFLPVMLTGCLVTSLSAEGVWFAVGLAQLVFWLGAVISWRMNLRGFPWGVLAGFLLLNVAVILAWRNFLSGKSDVWSMASSHDSGDNLGKEIL